jgi:hypothetical protein
MPVMPERRLDGEAASSLIDQIRRKFHYSDPVLDRIGLSAGKVEHMMQKERRRLEALERRRALRPTYPKVKLTPLALRLLERAG